MIFLVVLLVLVRDCFLWLRAVVFLGLCCFWVYLLFRACVVCGCCFAILAVWVTW